MRRYFGTWGVELTDDEFAQAFAAMGVLETALRPRPPTPEELYRQLRAKYPAQSTGMEPLQWAMPPPPEALLNRRIPTPPPSALAEAWRMLLAVGTGDGSRSVPLRPRLVIIRSPWLDWPEDHSLEVFDWLARPAVGCASVFSPLAVPKPPREPDRWPLRVGLLPGPAADAHLAALADRASLPFSHFKPEVLTPARARCGLLVLPEGLREAAGALLAAPVRPDADTVLVLGPMEEAGSRAQALVQTLLELSGARVVILARASTRAASPEVTALSVTDLVTVLSHNEPLDVAAFTAASWHQRPAPYLHGDSGFLEVARLATRMGKLSERISRVPFSDAPVPGSLPGLESFTVPAPSLKTLGKALDRAGPTLDWQRESGAATGLTELDRLSRNLSADAAGEAPRRFLRTRVVEPGSEGSEKRVETLQPARSYRADVSIGPHTPEYLSLDQAFPSLRDVPPDSADGHRLRVVFFDPRLMGEPQSDEVLLPPVGESTACGFHFYTREGVDALEARITVLHRNRVLQTGVLRGSLQGRQALTFQLDAAPRTRLQTLGERSYFDGALVLNHTDGGEEVATATSDTVVARIKLDNADLTGLTAALNAQLSRIARKPEDYRALRDSGNVELLRDLARRGARFHEVLADHSIIGPRFHGQGPVQIVTARYGGFLPIELAYRFPCPDEDAPLCAHAEAGLETGTCPAPCRDGGTEGRVCPLGFWSLSRVIERHEHRREHTAMDTDYELRAEPVGSRNTLARPSAAVLAASPRASAAEPEAVRRLHGALEELFGGKVYEARTWKDWVEDVRQRERPMLLVLLPHHLMKLNEVLELGEDDTLESYSVGLEHVVGKPPVAPPHPVVLLLGCETQLARVAFDSFAATFRKRGAAIVVSTIATVLGRDAAPVAAELARELATRRPGERTFGEVLLRARRKLLSQGRVMVLSLTAYGDADWKLTES